MTNEILTHNEDAVTEDGVLSGLLRDVEAHEQAIVDSLQPSSQREVMVSRLEAHAEMTDMRYSLWGCNNEWVVFLTGTQGVVMHTPWRAYRLEHQEDRSWRVVDVSEISEAAMAADPDFAHDFASFSDGFVVNDMPRKLLQPIIDEIDFVHPSPVASNQEIEEMMYTNGHVYINFGGDGANGLLMTTSLKAIAKLLQHEDSEVDTIKFDQPHLEDWLNHVLHAS